MSDFNLIINIVSPLEPTPSIFEIGGGSSPGSNINITGEDFSTAGAVYFNNTPASIVSWTEALIVATIPDIPSGTYDVIVDPSGAYNVAIKSFTVTKTEELPTGTMTINSGDTSTNSRTIGIAFTTSNISPTSLRLRNVNESWSESIAYAQSVQWVLSSGSGLKVVEAELTDGTKTIILSDSIALEEVLPGEIELTSDDIIIVYGPTVVSVNEDATSDVYRRIN